MKRLISVLTLLVAMSFAAPSFATTGPSCGTKVKHTAMNKQLKSKKHKGKFSPVIYGSGDCSSCAAAATADFYDTPVGREYALEHGAIMSALITDPLVTVEPGPGFIMPSNTIIIPDATYTNAVRKTTVGGYTVVTTDNARYYDPFTHHYMQHNTKGFDKTANVGVSPRAASMPESFGTQVKEQ